MGVCLSRQRKHRRAVNPLLVGRRLGREPCQRRKQRRKDDRGRFVRGECMGFARYPWQCLGVV